MAEQNKIKLVSIEEAIEGDENITTRSRDNNIIKAEEIIVIKRDGREEKYDSNKMRKVCMWACDNDEYYTQELLTNTRIKLYNKIKIADVYDELIKTAVNSISRIHPKYEIIAARLFLLKVYRESWNIKTNNEYPHLKTVVDKGLNSKLYSRECFKSFNDAELEQLNAAIDPNRDYLFTYKSLYTFYSKYCLNYSKNKKLELMQHAYMRISMFLFHKETENRIEKIIQFYDMLSQHYFTLATPIVLNAGTQSPQLSSCVLSKMGDSAESIMDSSKDIAIYSKYKGGNAVDISSIRASGSYILGNSGYSSGPVPFLKIVESTIKAFNQGSSRPGACAVYFQWWHYNFEELIVLKSNSGTEENRARHLKYSVKINDLLIKRFLAKENVTLFDPNEVPLLMNKYGKEFEEQYVKYEQMQGVRKKVIPAKKVFEMIMKERVETGNIYLFHEENVNKVSMLNRYINSSNLCCEITLPSRNSISKSERIFNEGGKYIISKEYQAGEISLCNLASINLVEWCSFSRKKKVEVVQLLVRAMDNTVDLAKYPVMEGQITNQDYRYLGIGVLNYANYIASKKIQFDSQESLEETARIFDELSYDIINASVELAREKGPYKNFRDSLWAKGYVPLFKAEKKALMLTKYKPDINRWKELSEKIKMFGLRNAQLMAIAPTATSGKAINATESIEPIQNFFYKEDGKVNLPTLIPNIKNWKNYKLSFDCDQYKLIELAAIRQIYLDQAQSINMYFKKVTSVSDFTLYHLYAFELGVKTLYYCKTEKDVADYVCESCS